MEDFGLRSTIDFEAINQLIEDAYKQDRDFLYEHETYNLLASSGAETPPETMFLPRGSRPSDEELMSMDGEKVVLKIVSPAIVHKTEVGGVRVVEKRPERIRSAWRRMMYEVAENYAGYLEKSTDHGPDRYRGLADEHLLEAIAADIKGVLMVQYMPPDSEAFGNELIVGIRNTREFGMVISAGLGGTDTELYAERFRKGQAIVASSTVENDGGSFFRLFKKTICYKKLAGLTRGQRRIVTDEQIIECFGSMIDLANYYSPLNPEAPWVIEELEINPFAFTDFLMVPLDGMCRFTRPGRNVVGRPWQKISKLLKPETIGLIGVSEKRINFGRVILNNIVANGFNPDCITIMRPGVHSIDNIRCVPDLQSSGTRFDLLILAVGAEQALELVDEVVEDNLAESVMLIAGGMGETEESGERANTLMEKIRKGHSRKDGGQYCLVRTALASCPIPVNMIRFSFRKKNCLVSGEIEKGMRHLSASRVRS